MGGLTEPQPVNDVATQATNTAAAATSSAAAVVEPPALAAIDGRDSGETPCRAFNLLTERSEDIPLLKTP